MTATLTIELKSEVGQKLAELSERTRQPAAALAAEAVASYVKRESRILDAVARGLAGMKAGRLVRTMRPWMNSTPRLHWRRKTSDAAGSLVAACVGRR